MNQELLNEVSNVLINRLPSAIGSLPMVGLQGLPSLVKFPVIPEKKGEEKVSVGAPAISKEQVSGLSGDKKREMLFYITQLIDSAPFSKPAYHFRLRVAILPRLMKAGVFPDESEASQWAISGIEYFAKQKENPMESIMKTVLLKALTDKEFAETISKSLGVEDIFSGFLRRRVKPEKVRDILSRLQEEYSSVFSNMARVSPEKLKILDELAEIYK